MANRKLMLLLTELKELNGRILPMNIVLLAERADILSSVSFVEMGPCLKRRQDKGFY